MTEQPDHEEKPLSRAERIALRVSIVQTCLAVTGFLVGCIALYAALNEADAVRKQQQAAVWPRLVIERDYTGNDGEEEVAIVVSNRGIGPALIKTIEIKIDGKPQSNWWELLAEIDAKQRKSSDFLISNSAISNSVISANTAVNLVSIDENSVGKDMTRALRNAYDNGRMTLSICYCSVFDDCWKARSGYNPEPTDTCKTQESSNF